MRNLILAAMPLLATPLAAQGTPEVEPNDDYTTATTLANNAQAFGDITAGEADYFLFTLTATADVDIWTAPGFGSQVGDTKLYLYDATGTNQLAYNDDGPGAFDYYSHIFAAGLTAGDYYVAVTGYSATTAGSYTLDVTVGAPGFFDPPGSGLTPVAEGAEENDPRLTGGVATVSAIGTVNSGYLDGRTGSTSGTNFVDTCDFDFFEFVVTTPGTYELETIAGAASPAVSDTSMFLVDGTLSVLDSDDDGGSGLLSFISYDFTTAGTYYAVVRAYSPSTTGNYDLEIRAPAAPPTAVSVTAHAGGCAGTAGTPMLDVRTSPFGSRVDGPLLGSEFYMDGTSLPANALILKVFGLQALATPYDLSPLGATGCQVEVNPIDQSVDFADGAGAFFWGISAPAYSWLIGLPVHAQLAVLDPGANPLGLTLSNRLSLVYSNIR